MYKLPCLIFNSNAELMHAYRLSEAEIDSLFTHALTNKDIRVFKRFCSTEFDSERADFKLFNLSDESKYSFAFLEKNKLKGATLNFVYLTDDLSHFYPLMSPTSQHYRETTGRFVHEMLSLSHTKEEDVPFLTPSAFTVLKSISGFRDVIFANPRKLEFCDLQIITERMIKQIKNVPTLRKTKFVFNCQSSDKANSAGLIDFSITAYIYLFVSLIYIFHVLSLEHTVNISIDFDSLQGNLCLSTTISKYRTFNEEISSLAQLVEFLPGIDSIATTASFVSFGTDFATVVSYDSVTRTLSTSVRLGESKSLPQFRYQDTCSDISEIFLELSHFSQTLVNQI